MATGTVTVEGAREPAALVLDPGRDRLIIVASSLGTVFEWYDFFVYGTLAALLGRLFFPSANATAGLLLSLATFGAGFGVRPIGAVVFGILGDRIGRKHTFLATITLMGLATALVGFLPTFAVAGIWAPVLLVVLRLLQGLALGGEYGGAAIYLAEHAPKGRRGFFTSFIQASVVGGFLLSLFVTLGTTAAVGKDRLRGVGLAHPVRRVAAAARGLALHSPQAARESGLHGDEGEGTDQRQSLARNVRDAGQRAPAVRRAVRHRRRADGDLLYRRSSRCSISSSRRR